MSDRLQSSTRSGSSSINRFCQLVESDDHPEQQPAQQEPRGGVAPSIEQIPNPAKQKNAAHHRVRGGDDRSGSGDVVLQRLEGTPERKRSILPRHLANNSTEQKSGPSPSPTSTRTIHHARQAEYCPKYI